jgi:hypothetical protein
VEVSHGHEDNDRCHNDIQAPSGGEPSDEGALEQYNREGDKVENPTTPLIETRYNGNDRRWIPEQDEPLTQQPEGIPSVELRHDPHTNQRQ